MLRKHADRRGFTLAELVLVIAIIGILAAGALPLFKGAITRTRYAEAMHMAQAIAGAEMRYYYAHDALTPHLDDLDIKVDLSATIPGYGYYGYITTGTDVGFGLGRLPGTSPINTVTDHKLGIDMMVEDGIPRIRYYWWREDLPGQLGGKMPLRCVDGNVKPEHRRRIAFGDASDCVSGIPWQGIY